MQIEKVLIAWEFRWSSNGWFCSTYRVGGLVDYYSDLILGLLINKSNIGPNGLGVQLSLNA